MAEVLCQILREYGNSSRVLSLSLQAIAAEHIHAVDAHREHQHVLCDPQLHQNIFEISIVPKERTHNTQEQGHEAQIGEALLPGTAELQRASQVKCPEGVGNAGAELPGATTLHRV